MDNNDVRSKIAREIRLQRKYYHRNNSLYGHSDAAQAFHSGVVGGLLTLAVCYFPKQTYVRV